MIRSIYISVTAIVATLLSAPIVLMVRSTSPITDRLIRWWGRAIVRSAGLEIRGENLQRLEHDRRYILISNHYSYIDIPCLLSAIEQPVRFLAKKSLFQVPLFGWAIKKAGFIPIDRKNRRSAVDSLNMAASRIRMGNSIAIFPEEGRTSTRELKPFMRGAFLLAIRSGLPIVPIAIDGTYEALPVGKFAIKPGLVTIRVGEPIDSSRYTVRTKDELRDAARGQIERMLGVEGP